MNTQFAKSYVRRRKISHHTGGQSYTPPQLSKIYNFPSNLDGTGQTIGFIELGGGFVQSDLDNYFHSLGLKSPTVKFVSVDGATNSPSTPNSADGEVMLDLCVAIGLANGITPVVYMADNSSQGFVNAINQAVADNVDVISISWGGPENTWDSGSVSAMNAAFQAAIAKGIVVTVAAGDNGSSDGESGNNCDFPASSPYVVACGGTSLVTNGSQVTSETVWNDGSQGGATGGGVSSLFSLPSYQANAGVPGGTHRGSPDVAAVADPETGIVIIVDGQTMVIGGTSAVAPFWAAVVAILNQGLGKRIGSLNPILYGIAMPYTNGVLRDITVGNNGTYIAKSGWDACTGIGVPNVANLLNYLGGPPPVSSASSSSSEPSHSSAPSQVLISVNHAIYPGKYVVTTYKP